MHNSIYDRKSSITSRNNRQSMYLRSEFRVVMSVAISAQKLCSVRHYLQLFVGGIMSYLRYLCLFAYIGAR
jgi:hypothetical protein